MSRSKRSTIGCFEDFPRRGIASQNGWNTWPAVDGQKEGILPSIRGPIDAIVEAGLFISPKHLADIRERAGES